MGDRAADTRPDLDEVVRELRRPFTTAAVKWKIQTNPKDEGKSALCVAFIDARLVAERLNAVVGSDWDDEYLTVAHDPRGAERGVLCKLTVRGHSRTDVGWAAQDPKTDMGLKGLYSDAFKRAAVKFGIGVSVYALPQQWVKASDLDSWNSQKGKRYAMSRKAEAQLRQAYEKWLKDRGVELFGEPLDHGDVDETVGDHEAAGVTGATEAPQFGEAASDEQIAQVTRAMQWMGGEPTKVLGTLHDSLGYVPAVVVRGIALAAKSAKERKEQQDGSSDSTEERAEPSGG